MGPKSTVGEDQTRFSPDDRNISEHYLHVSIILSQLDKIGTPYTYCRKITVVNYIQSVMIIVTNRGQLLHSHRFC